MLPHGDIMYHAYYQYKMGESAPTSVQPSILLPPPASTSPPSILILEWVVTHVSSSSRTEAKPSPLNRTSCLPRTAQPLVMFVVPTIFANAAKGKVLVL